MGGITTGGVQSAKLQQSSDDGDTDDYSDLEGSSITIADDDDNGLVTLDIKRPQKRYLKCVVSRATQDSAVDGIFALQYGARTLPITNGELHEQHGAPDEGTA